MSEMKSLTLNDKTYDCFVDSVARSQVEATTVVNSASGETIALSDASNYKLLGLHIYGKTTKDGTPTPNAPVDIVSVGDKGTVNVAVRGKNIADIYGFSADGIANPDSVRKVSNVYGTTISTTEPSDTIVVAQTEFPDSAKPHNFTNGYFNIGFYGDLREEEQVTISFDVEITNNLSNDNIIVFSPNGLTFQEATVTNGRVQKTVSWKTAGDKRYLEIRLCGKSMIISNIQIEVGGKASEYEPHKKQTFAMHTYSGLNGFPVTSGGNYTDANGQQWICDEVDLARGVTVLRIGEQILTGNENILDFIAGDGTVSVPLVPTGKATSMALCTHGEQGREFELGNDGNALFRASYFNVTTLSEFKEFLKKEYNAGKPVTIWYVLSRTVEVTITEADLAAYAALHTYRGNTTVTNDASAHMELEYVMDAKKYIDSQISAGILAATVE